MESFSDYESEIKLLLEEMAKNPKSKAFVRLGNIYLKTEMFNEAMDVVKEGLRYSPDNVSGLAILAKCQKEKKNLLEAVKLFEKVLSIDPQHIISMISLAEIKKRQGDLESAYKMFDNVLFLDPSNDDVKKEVKLLKRQIADAKAEKERMEKMKKNIEAKSEVDQEPVEDKKYVDEFIIQHSSTVINFDDDEQEEKKVNEEKQEVEEKKNSETAEKSKEGQNNDSDAKEEQKEKEESTTEVEMLDESAYINPEVEPYLEKKKENETFIPYELPGVEKFMYYSLEMASIYAEQEQYERAVEVYQMLLRQNPQDEEIAEKIRTLREQMAKKEITLESFRDKEEKKKQSRTEFIDRLNQSLSVENATEEELKIAESKFKMESDEESDNEKEHTDKKEMTDEEKALMEKYSGLKSEEKKTEKKKEHKSKAVHQEEEKKAAKNEEDAAIVQKQNEDKKNVDIKEKTNGKVLTDIDRIKDIPNNPEMKTKKNEDEKEKNEENTDSAEEKPENQKQEFSAWLKNVNKFKTDNK